jgi:hypothetical protein
MRTAVNNDVPVRRPAVLVPPLIHDLDVHSCADSRLDVLALRLAHPAEHAHQHLVRRIPSVELPAQFETIWGMLTGAGLAPRCGITAEPAGFSPAHGGAP